MTGYELERVETLLRERSAEMTRTRATTQLHPSLDGVPTGQSSSREPVVEVSLEGTCTECGDRIAPARLKALPDAARCLSCQRDFELGAD